VKIIQGYRAGEAQIKIQKKPEPDPQFS